MQTVEEVKKELARFSDTVFPAAASTAAIASQLVTSYTYQGLTPAITIQNWWNTHQDSHHLPVSSASFTPVTQVTGLSNTYNLATFAAGTSLVGPVSQQVLSQQSQIHYTTNILGEASQGMLTPIIETVESSFQPISDGWILAFDDYQNIVASSSATVQTPPQTSYIGYTSGVTTTYAPIEAANYQELSWLISQIEVRIAGLKGEIERTYRILDDRISRIKESIFEVIRDKFSILDERINRIKAEVFKVIKDKFDTLSTRIEGLKSYFELKLTSEIAKLETRISNIQTNILSKIEPRFRELERRIESLERIIDKKVDEAVAGLWTRILAVVEKAKEFLQGLIDSAIKMIRKFVDFLLSKLKEVWDFLQDIMEKVKKLVSELLEKALKPIREAVEEIIKKLKEIPFWAEMITKVLVEVEKGL